MKHYANNPLLTMDNIILTLDYINVEKLDYLRINSRSMAINKFDIDRRVDIYFFDAIFIFDKILLK